MPGRPRSWTDDDLARACEVAESIADVCRMLGLKSGGGTYQHLHASMKRLGLTIRHHDPWAWMRKPGANTRGRTMPLEEALTNPSPYLNIGRLRQRLVAAGLKQPKCERCGLDSWLGAELPLELDHIDGERTNNLLENLRMLCPNCHAQTETWCRKRSSRPT